MRHVTKDQSCHTQECAEAWRRVWYVCAWGETFSKVCCLFIFEESWLVLSRISSSKGLLSHRKSLFEEMLVVVFCEGLWWDTGLLCAWAEILSKSPFQKDCWPPNLQNQSGTTTQCKCEKEYIYLSFYRRAETFPLLVSARAQQHVALPHLLSTRKPKWNKQSKSGNFWILLVLRITNFVIQIFTLFYFQLISWYKFIVCLNPLYCVFLYQLRNQCDYCESRFTVLVHNQNPK